MPLPTGQFLTAAPAAGPSSSGQHAAQRRCSVIVAAQMPLNGAKF